MLGFSDHYTAQSNHDVLKLINLHSLIFKGAIVSVQAVSEMKRCSVSVYCMKWKVSCCAAQYSPGHMLRCARCRGWGITRTNPALSYRHHHPLPPLTNTPHNRTYLPWPLPASLALSPHTSMVRCLVLRVPPWAVCSSVPPWHVTRCTMTRNMWPGRPWGGAGAGACSRLPGEYFHTNFLLLWHPPSRVRGAVAGGQISGHSGHRTLSIFCVATHPLGSI